MVDARDLKPPQAPSYKISSMVTLYVLKGETGRRYVGITNNLSRRLHEHRAKNSKGGQMLGKLFVIICDNLWLSSYNHFKTP
ncbi:MAG: GIY-YIG nuclease family protein [Deltaproteobacteria bacterium]|nr:GIY-YIG nuclease family protein [Deltaproteobacteria bacterium]